MSPADRQVGYNALITRYGLCCVEDRTSSFIAKRRSVVDRTERADGSVVACYPGKYDFDDTLSAHLEFCLKYEGVNLSVLAALFEQRGADELQAWLDSKPGSRYARVCSHLYEWLTGKTLRYKLPAGIDAVPVLDEKRYFTAPAQRNRRFAVLHNLPGTPAFCPLVRRTPTLDTWIKKDLGAKIAQVLAGLEPELLERAVNYLYLAETRSSFAIEKDVPDSQRAERFRRLLERAGEDTPLEEQTFVAWQNVVVANPRGEFSYRQKQNWLSRSGRSARVADFIPPAAADVAAMLEGIVKTGELVKSKTYPTVLAAACAAFGFVFVHPFFDGNGRLHRFLLHHFLRLGSFTPPGAVVPVSAAMERDIARYAEVLKRYSAPRTAMLDYRLDSDANFIDVKKQPLYLYAFFDATELCEFTFACLERAIDHDLAEELAYLRAYDNAHQSLTRWLDAPQPELEKLIRYIAQNDGHLSKNKRGQFPLIGDADIARAETQISEAFLTYWKRPRPNKANDVSSRNS
ncbi:MAG: Fic family protein [Proteobacteria bacterium]|nr:Fic family protein [Pseudomonadota bacterium]